jgi:hypothetical protein
VQSGWGDAIQCLVQLLAQQQKAPRWHPTPAWDWRTFAESCDAHQLAPFIYGRLQRLLDTTGPFELLAHLRTRFHEACARNYQLAKELVSVTSRFEGEGVAVLAFKGPPLAMALYGGLSRRQCHDLDLLIRKDQLVKGASLMNRWGFQAIPMPASPQVVPYLCRPENRRDVERGQEIQFRSPDGTFFVDLHWQLGDRFWRSFGPDVDKLWDRAVQQELPLGSVSTPCREDLFLALCAHGTRHRSELSVPVKKNISFAGLVSSGPVGGDAVKNSIVVSKFSAILAFYFRVSANRCSVRVPGGNCLRLWPCQVRLA